MHKFWKLNDTRSNKLIFIKDNCIYKGNPKQEDLDRLTLRTTDLAFLENLFSIPYQYLTKIENQEGKKEIKLFYGGKSEEELVVDDAQVKREVFEFLKQDIPIFIYTSQLPPALKYAKNQLIALLIVTAIFLWTLYLAIQIESGVNYEIIGKGRPGITEVVLGLAHFGVSKVATGFSVLMVLILLGLKHKMNYPEAEP